MASAIRTTKAPSFFRTTSPRCFRRHATAGAGDDALFHTQPVRGVCRVICFSPRHDLTLARMAPAEIRRVIDTWAEQTEELGRDWRWVQVFENKGDVMGCSNPHPHGQIWASDELPNEIAKEDREQRGLFSRETGRRCSWITRGANASAASESSWKTSTGSRSCPTGRSGPSKSCCCRCTRVARLHDLDGRAARCARRDSAAPAHALRQSFRDFLPLLDGLAWRAFGVTGITLTGSFTPIFTRRCSVPRR